jgi:hypothetical protein
MACIRGFVVPGMLTLLSAAVLLPLRFTDGAMVSGATTDA